MSTRDSKPFPYAFFGGMQTPIEKAQISIMSKVVQYGLGWFGGVRGYISTDKKSINIFRLEDHIKRFLNSSKVLGVQIKYDAEQLKKNLLDLININRPQTDTYFRPFAYADSTELSPNFAQNSTFDFALYMVPLGDYIDTTKGNSVCVSSWRRVSDNAIPSRAKLAGSYVNSALAKQEAIKNGFVESIMLSETGEVTEGSAMNLFIVRDGKLITPSSTSDNTSPKIMAHKNPSTWKPGTTLLTNKTNSALMTKVNKPKVKILIGKVRSIKIGFNTAFTIPKATATTTAVQKFSTVTPGST
jgi:branched-chain amino acid aminotransferase